MRWRVKFLSLADQSVAAGVFEATSANELDETLARDGKVVLNSAPIGRWELFAGFGSRGASIALLCEELKALLDAGLNLVEALETLSVSLSGSTEARLVERLLARVREGKRLSDAMEEDRAIPRVLVAVVKGSEFTSGVAQALGRYLDYHRRLDELKNRAISASIYPGIVLSLGVVIVLFLLGYVVPRFSAIYADHAGSMSAAGSFILRLGDFVGRYIWFLVAALIALTVWCVFAVNRLARGGVRVDTLRALPVLSRVIDDLEHARLFETLAMLTGGGFPLPTALRIGRDVALTARTAHSVEEVCRDVEAGGALSAALRRHAVGEEVAARLAAAGENSGNLARALDHVGEHHSRRFSRRVERLTRIIEPLLLILVGSTIGVIVVLMYMPIFDLAGSLR